MKDALDAMVKKYPNRVTVTYSLTGEDKTEYEYGRGSVDLAKRALPPPTSLLQEGEKSMIFVYGKDGFVETWAGSVCRAPSEGGKKGKKIQGPLMGVLADAGYRISVCIS